MVRVGDDFNAACYRFTAYNHHRHHHHHHHVVVEQGSLNQSLVLLVLKLLAFR